jgi:hypothetical protein
MTRAWRIRVSGRPKRQPDTALLVQAVLLLAEELAQRAEASDDTERSHTTEAPKEAS